jgi:hypothetical protein
LRAARLENVGPHVIVCDASMSYGSVIGKLQELLFEVSRRKLNTLALH